MTMRHALIFFFVASIVPLPLTAHANTNTEAKIVAHLQTIPVGKNPPPICDGVDLRPCNAGDSTLTVHGSTGVGYRLYLLVMDGNSEAGVAGATFGISYGTNLAVNNWVLCGSLDFPGGPSGLAWPDSGCGNLITWAECQDSVAQGDSTGGVTTVLGALYVYAYGSDVFRITRRDYIDQPDFQVADCNGQTSDLPYPSQAGAVGFGSNTGADPCQDQEELGEDDSGSTIPIMWTRTASGSFELSTQTLDSLLSKAPSQFSEEALTKTTLIELPMPDGTYERVSVKESSVLSPDLAYQHPDVGTYVVEGVDNPWLSGRIGMVSRTFHAWLFEGPDVILVDRLIVKPGEYRSYYRSNVKGGINCLVGETSEEGEGVSVLPLSSGGAPPSIGDTLYSYDLAVHATGEYTSFFAGEVDSAEGEIIIAINKVNAIFERDASIHFNLVHRLAYAHPDSDAYGSARFLWFGENQSAIDESTAAHSVTYNIGHLFSYGDSGGATEPGSGACIDGKEARAWSVYPDPTSAVFISYVAHEIGHQLSALHTMTRLADSTGARCDIGDTWRGVEPASGSTIMSYAGLYPDSCDVEPTDDGYFHGWNIEQLVAYRDTTCAAKMATGNSPPVIEGLPDFTIPRSTPFALEASGTDLDGDSLSYCWQQIDVGTFQTWPDHGPLFRSWPPTLVTSKRTLPRFADILSGPSSNILDTFELLPKSDRDLTFRVTARDRGGGVTWEDVLIRVRGIPFAITFPNGGDTLVAGDSTTITWDTGDTDSTGTTLVDLWLVLDDDEAKQYPLRKNISNDGSFRVAVPNVSSTKARFSLRAVDNVYFDVSDSNFTILGTATSVGLEHPVPSRLGLRIHPNPSSTSATILLMVPASRADQVARVDVLDVAGRMVRNLAEVNVPEGEHRFSWDGRDDSGRKVSTGIYFVRARIEHGPQLAQKILLME